MPLASPSNSTSHRPACTRSSPPTLYRPGRGESLGSHVARCERFRILKRQVDPLTGRIHREEQFNRKVAMSQELKPLKGELERLVKP